MTRGRPDRVQLRGDKCAICGEHLSLKNLCDGEGVALVDAVEGQLFTVCLYHLTRYNPKLPAQVGELVLGAVKELIPLRSATHGRPSWHEDCPSCTGGADNADVE